MHSYLENIGVPYLENRVSAAKSLVDQHARPSCEARYRFGAAATDTSLQLDRTDEDSQRPELQEAAKMVKGLQVFAIKLLRRNGLHLVDDMFR
jgi:hypothetical protein